ncbi:MAG: hypothetical protein ACK4L7_02755, partial [Flavobacteriales bacterium]
ELAPSEDLEAPPAFWERWRPFLLYVLPLLSIFGLVVGAGAEYTLTGASLFGGLTYNNAFSNLLGKDAKRLVNENSKSKLYASYLEITAGVFF